MSDRRVYRVGAGELVIQGGSVLDADADVVVSSDDHMLSMGGGVSAAIRRAAGGAILVDAAKMVPAAAGDVVVTTAGALTARYVFHVVTMGPDHWSSPPDEAQTLALVQRATRRCLHLVEALDVRSIVMPALGTGTAGFTVAAAAEAMAAVVAEELARSRSGIRVTIMLKAGLLSSPMRFLDFYEEFARRLPKGAAPAPVADVEPPTPDLPPIVALEQERAALEQRLAEIRGPHGSTDAEQRVRGEIVRNTEERLRVVEHMGTTRRRPVRVFVSYSRQDEHLRRQLSDHLGGLRTAGLVEDWDDGDIGAGAEWEDEIRERMRAAEIILLLLSPDFLSSAFITGVELAEALDLRRAGRATVIPVVMRPVHWQDTDLGQLQALPPGGKAVTLHADRDAVLVDVVKEVSRVAKAVQLARRDPAGRPAADR